MNIRKIMAMSCAAVCFLTMASCGKKSFKKREKVTLNVWKMEDEALLQQMADNFVEHYKDEADIEIILGNKPEHSMTEYINDNPDDSADILYFADDQLDQLYNARYLLPITENKDQIIADNGGRYTDVISCVVRELNLYACPITAGNGYFLYYNAKYLNESDVQSLDNILEIAGKNNKFFAMDWSSGWYTYSFFGGAGLTAEANPGGTFNECDWNSTENKYKGVDVAQAMLDISSSKGFRSTESPIDGASDDSVIAFVSGQWDYEKLRGIWGDDLRATKLPTFTVNGDQVQMSGFMGYKYVGVYSGTKNPEWAVKFAEWVSNYDNQVERFKVTGECPSNVEAMQAEEVQSSPAVVAIGEQSAFSVRQNVTDAYWTPSSLLGSTLAAGNPDKIDLQELLDDVTAEINAR
ncbi:MAG: extracellular solute-binding protein [Ruminococcus sp.]|uniref:extracellular solute-binding protein n=1 Tax=Ruminococcus sp. TaxID=41978 RepID=UPI0025DD390F|nr:extracellular solute-binding protein [Ruminococcus sp.]MCR5601433.1 extracellular solute-binding protein [Ruminococcus sp.]